MNLVAYFILQHNALVIWFAKIRILMPIALREAPVLFVACVYLFIESVFSEGLLSAKSSRFKSNKASPLSSRSFLSS